MHPCFVFLRFDHSTERGKQMCTKFFSGGVFKTVTVFAFFLLSKNVTAGVSDGFWCRPIKGQEPVANVQSVACGKLIKDSEQTTVCVQNVECAFVGKEAAADLKQRQTKIEENIRKDSKVGNSPMDGPYDPTPAITELNVQLSQLGNDLVFLTVGVDWLKSTVTCQGKVLDGQKGKGSHVECPSANDCKNTTLLRAVAAVPALGGVKGVENVRYERGDASGTAGAAR